jgi:hypothetical protein
MSERPSPRRASWTIIPFVSGPPPALFASYLQPGSVVVCPGGWHFAPGSCGPLLLSPGPKSGSANAAPENDIISANMAAEVNNVMRLRISVTSFFLIVFHPIASPR